MTFEGRISAAFNLDDEGWALHSNLWSGWTRIPALALLVIALWSRVWIGWWAALPVAAVVIWIAVNPRFFPPPRSTDNWASKGTFGERVWINRAVVPVPERYRVVPHILNGISAVGGVILIWGVASLSIWPTLLGTALAYAGKLWFVDRMVWLYEDMKDATPEYRSWLR